VGEGYRSGIPEQESLASNSVLVMANDESCVDAVSFNDVAKDSADRATAAQVVEVHTYVC
jgi:hypothetical protein